MDENCGATIEDARRFVIDLIFAEEKNGKQRLLALFTLKIRPVIL